MNTIVSLCLLACVAVAYSSALPVDEVQYPVEDVAPEGPVQDLAADESRWYGGWHNHGGRGWGGGWGGGWHGGGWGGRGWGGGWGGGWHGGGWGGRGYWG